MKILVLTDSLSLPRSTVKEKVFYEDTYPYLLQEEFPQHQFIFLGIGGATIVDLHRQSSYFTGFYPDIVFLQCGVVDCAPRPFRKLESRIINKLKLRFLFKPFIKSITKYRNYRYTKHRKFNTLIVKLKELFSDSKVYSIGILPACKEYEQKLNGITKSINAFNVILSENLQFIDNSDFPKDGILSDFHHLNAKGHSIIFKKLSVILKS